ncbi:hypothetical protein MNBD_GAMMA21-1980 [hydrothermal vent metagenome]|uniref:Uncharacterized protein n=1 Tax=hydrothermal vent metagenome TaxID=652676 RepID=A0A3B1B4Q5_9ZZZZ
MMKFLSAIMLTLSTSVSLAVEVQQGQIYPGGTYVESSQTGVGLIIPRGWQGAWPAGSDVFVLESTGLKANIFMTFEQGTEAGLRNLMSNRIPLDASTQLVPASSPKRTGNIYTANYTVAGAPQLSGFMAAQILPSSLGVAFIALSADASSMRQVKQVTLQLANGLTVKQPVANQSTARSGGSGKSEFYQSGDASAVSDGNCTYFSSGASSMSTCD